MWFQNRRAKHRKMQRLQQSQNQPSQPQASQQNNNNNNETKQQELPPSNKSEKTKQSNENGMVTRWYPFSVFSGLSREEYLLPPLYNQCSLANQNRLDFSVKSPPPLPKPCRNLTQNIFSIITFSFNEVSSAKDQ